MALRTIVVRWRGPFDYHEICAAQGGKGLYLLTGRTNYGRRAGVQYCGMTEGRFCDRLTTRHHKLPGVRAETLQVWLGTIVHPRRVSKRHLHIAEHCLISYQDTPLNSSKYLYPKEPVCLVSEWYTPDGLPRMKRPAALRDFRDVVWWDTERWRCGRLRVWGEGE